jgi:hypothetical protein
LTSNAAPLGKPLTICTQTSAFIQAERDVVVKIIDPARQEKDILSAVLAGLYKIVSGAVSHFGIVFIIPALILHYLIPGVIC